MRRSCFDWLICNPGINKKAARTKKSNCEIFSPADPKEQNYIDSKNVGAVPRTASQARSGIGPYIPKAVSSSDNTAR
jgi:hypothetical protein